MEQYKDCSFIYKWHFHWKFWVPKDCVGGPVYFGYWATCGLIENGILAWSEQSEHQVMVKQSIRLFLDRIPLGI